jgi:hypothetical protein
MVIGNNHMVIGNKHMVIGNNHMVISGYHHLYGRVNNHNRRRLVHGWCKQPLWCMNQFQNFYPSLIPNDVFILVYSMQEAWACAIFFALTHLWGGLPFHQQVIFNHNFWMTTFTRLFIMKIFTLFDFNLPFGPFLYFPQSNPFITQLLCFLSAVKIGASSARISRCAHPRAGSRLYRSCVLPIGL